MRYSRRREASWTLRLTDWILEDPDGYEAARAARRRLGRLPRRAQGERVIFNSDHDIKTYDGLPAKALARIAQHICGAASDENGLLWALRGITHSLIAPLLAYMRVNFALARLAAAIGEQPPQSEQNYPGEDDLALPVLAVRSGAPKPREKTAALHMIKKPPTFTWAQTPRSIYGFEALQAQWGYDPRGTSVHWIEKRAARLRAAWRRHHRDVAPPCAPPPPPSPYPPLAPVPVRHFVPMDADYNTIWPPIELPKAPPKTKALAPVHVDCSDLDHAVTNSRSSGSTPAALAGMTEMESPALPMCHSGRGASLYPEAGEISPEIDIQATAQTTNASSYVDGSALNARPSGAAPAASAGMTEMENPAADIFAAFAAIGFYAEGETEAQNIVSAPEMSGPDVPESREPQALPGTGLLKWSVQKGYQPPPPPPPPPPPEKPPPPDVPEL